MQINLNKNQRLGLILILIIAGGFGVYFIGDYVGLWSIAPDATTPTTKATSTFTLIDYRTGEDVSAWVEVSVWTPDENDLPFDEEDPYIITNFEEDVQDQDADTVSIDLRDYNVAWLEIDPAFQSDFGGYFGVAAFNALTTRDMRKLTGGANYDYYVYVYHAPENVSVNLLTRGNMDGVLDATFGDARAYNNTFTPISVHNLRGVSGNYTVVLNMPYNSPHGWHAGTTGQDEWNIDADELAEIVAAAKIDYLQEEFNTDIQWLKDQSNFRTMAPYYDITDDNDRDFGDDLEQLTNAFAIRFGFNGSVSLTDGNAAQVNLTIRERNYNAIPAEVVYSGAYIYVVFYEPITCYGESYNFDIELEFTAGVGALWMGNVTTVRLEVPRGDTNLGTAAALGLMRLVNYPKCP